MEGQLNAVAQTLLIKNATNVTLYRSQAELQFSGNLLV